MLNRSQSKNPTVRWGVERPGLLIGIEASHFAANGHQWSGDGHTEVMHHVGSRTANIGTHVWEREAKDAIGNGTIESQ